MAAEYSVSTARLTSLSARMALIFLVLIVGLGGSLIWLAQTTAQQGELAALQGINRSTAMYIAEQAPVIDEQGVNEDRLSKLAARAMIINPALEIYVLNPEGAVLAHRLPTESVVLSEVDTASIARFLVEDGLPIMGDDPRRPDELTAFSVAPVLIDGVLHGYVYVVVGGEVYHQMKAAAENTYYQNLFTSLAMIAVLSTVLVGGWLTLTVTRPLRQLRQAMTEYQVGDRSLSPVSGDSHNEVTQLQHCFATLQDTIATQLESIEQLDRTRRELIANVSHDLRTPLAALQGALELAVLKSDALSPGDQHQLLQSAHKQSVRLGRLVNDLFELASLETDGQALETESFSICELLQDCRQDLMQLAERRGVTLALTMPPEGDAWVRADIRLMQRVLDNLVANAIRHTPRGGRVMLSVEVLEHGSRIAVADTGVGIDSHELPHIFDRFYQSKETEHSSQIGTGLGLAIVKRILAIHETDIQVVSRVNQGTRFEFELAHAG